MVDSDFIERLIEAAKRAGSKDPRYVASCARLYAHKHSIAEAIAVFLRNRPDLFY